MSNPSYLQFYSPCIHLRTHELGGFRGKQVVELLARLGAALLLNHLQPASPSPSQPASYQTSHASIFPRQDTPSHNTGARTQRKSIFGPERLRARSRLGSIFSGASSLAHGSVGRSAFCKARCGTHPSWCEIHQMQKGAKASLETHLSKREQRHDTSLQQHANRQCLFTEYLMHPINIYLGRVSRANSLR